MKKRQKPMVGGVVNKTLGKDNFDSFVQLLKNEGCEIKSISFSSLKGFVFKVHVKNLLEKDIEFYGLNETSNVFDKPVDTLVVKLAILYTGTGHKKNERILDLPNYQEVYNEQSSYNKQMESFSDFKNEAIAQSEIYEKTLLKGQPICPALIDFSHFTSMDSSMPFLNLLESKCIDNNDESKNMILYIKTILGTVRVCELGMITMESASKFDPFYDMYDIYGETDPSSLTTDGPSPSQINLCNDVIVQIIRLLNECRIIHCDLHGYNVMV